MAQLRRGQTGVICESKLAEDDAALLRAMGIAVDARIKLCRSGQPCIVAIGCACENGDADKGGVGRAKADRWDSCRIGLARRLAERITVVVDA